MKSKAVSGIILALLFVSMLTLALNIQPGKAQEEPIPIPIYTRRRAVQFVEAKSWTTTEVVSTESTEDSERPSLAVDSGGNIHVAWADRTDYSGSGDDTDIFYKKYEVGLGWTVTEVVSTESTGYSGSPSLAVDSSGNVHVAWTDLTDYGEPEPKRTSFIRIVHPPDGPPPRLCQQKALHTQRILLWLLTLMATYT